MSFQHRMHSFQLMYWEWTVYTNKVLIYLLDAQMNYYSLLYLIVFCLLSVLQTLIYCWGYVPSQI